MSVIKTSQLMLYREIMAVCSEIHTKHINTVCGQNVELLNVNLAVHIVTTVGTYCYHCTVHIVTTGLGSVSVPLCLISAHCSLYQTSNTITYKHLTPSPTNCNTEGTSTTQSRNTHRNTPQYRPLHTHTRTHTQFILPKQTTQS